MSTRTLCVLFFTVFKLNSAFADSCEGLGTVFVFGNGMFTTKDSARISKKQMEEAVSRGVSLEKSKDIQFDIAYKTNEFFLTQFKNVAVQKPSQLL